jgi:DNA-binding NarL/FixJ family response regulator
LRLGLTALLYRGEATFDRIRRAVLSAAAGRVELPEAVQVYLLDRARGDGVRPRDEGRAELSERELEVLRLIADGYSTRNIATALNYSERTVKNIVHDVVLRLQVRNRTHAVVHALRAGVL